MEIVHTLTGSVNGAINMKKEFLTLTLDAMTLIQTMGDEDDENNKYSRD